MNGHFLSSSDDDEDKDDGKDDSKDDCDKDNHKRVDCNKDSHNKDNHNKDNRNQDSHNRDNHNKAIQNRDNPNKKEEFVANGRICFRFSYSFIHSFNHVKVCSTPFFLTKTSINIENLLKHFLKEIKK